MSKSSPFFSQPKEAVILELSAAMGGIDAAVFAGELLRAYMRYASACGWQAELLQINQAGAGVRSAVLRLAGRGVSRMRSEAGTHRVQRQPANDRTGRRHTSAVTVAVLPVQQVTQFNLDMGEVKLETFRSSGPGGQHMQKTESAVRATHLPSGISAVISDDRSQHRNRQRALELLVTRLASGAEIKRHDRIAAERRSMKGSGHIAERVRTYAYRDNLVIDHRSGMRLPLQPVLDGDLAALVGS
jgi:peptide chain release factor 1